VPRLIGPSRLHEGPNSHLWNDLRSDSDATESRFDDIMDALRSSLGDEAAWQQTWLSLELGNQGMPQRRMSDITSIEKHLDVFKTVASMKIKVMAHCSDLFRAEFGLSISLFLHRYLIRND
jgi:hypothetical protein